MWIQRIAIIVAVTVVGSAAAWAQAWMPPKGQGALGVSYQYTTVGDHLFSVEEGGTNGFDLGDIDGQTVFFRVEYAFVDRFTTALNLAYVASRYEGPAPENPVIDDGDWHGSTQDANIGVRYQALTGRTVLTPSLSYGFPVVDYYTIGHASPGRGLNEWRVGLNLGHSFGKRRLTSFVQASVSYAFVEDLEVQLGGDDHDHDHGTTAKYRLQKGHPDGEPTGSVTFGMDRVDAFLEYGYMFNRRVGMSVLGAFSEVHDGIDWYEDLTPDSGLGHTHDQGAEAKILRYGFSVFARVGNITNISGSIVKTVPEASANTHDATAYTISASWAFHGLFKFGAPPPPDVNKAAVEAGSPLYASR